MVGLGKVIEMIGVQANAGTRSRIADLRLALRIVDEQLAVLVKIIAVTIAALPYVAFERGDPVFVPQRPRTDEIQQPRTPFDKQQRRLGRTVVHHLARHDAAGNVSLVAVERQHTVDQVALLRLGRPLEHRKNSFEERRIVRFPEIIERLHDQITGNLGLVVFVTVENSGITDRLRILDISVSLPYVMVELQNAAGLFAVSQRQQRPRNPVLIAHVAHVVNDPGQYAAFASLLALDQHADVVHGPEKFVAAVVRQVRRFEPVLLRRIFLPAFRTRLLQRFGRCGSDRRAVFGKPAFVRSGNYVQGSVARSHVQHPTFIAARSRDERRRTGRKHLVQITRRGFITAVKRNAGSDADPVTPVRIL